jgi:hypothetical protein
MVLDDEHLMKYRDRIFSAIGDVNVGYNEEKKGSNWLSVVLGDD